MNGDAILSPCGTYRYRLSRIWGPGPSRALFVMLNPSTADATEDDPTIRRCIGFARSWGLDGLLVGNLFAFRSPSPKDLKATPYPTGPDNDAHLDSMAQEARLVVVAWGAHGTLDYRDASVCVLLQHHASLYCLGKTAGGQPRHPLYVRADQELVLYAPRLGPSA